MILLFVIYGLAFFTLGTAVLVYPTSASALPLARKIWLLGVFGLLHGALELADALALANAVDPSILALVRPFLLVGSFAFLLQFGVDLLSTERRTRLVPLLAVLVVAIAYVTLDATTAGVLARYLLGFPGALLSGIGLLRDTRQGRTVDSVGARPARMLAGALFVYAFAAGLIVSPRAFFPASVLNTETFLAVFHMPVQVVRATVGVVATYATVSLLEVFRVEAVAALQRERDTLEVRVAERTGALEARTVELLRSNGELEQFAYVASHDLQEPLRAVAGCVELLQKRYRGKLDEGADELIGHTVDGAMRMQGLIEDLLAYSRVGMGEFAPANVDCAQAVRRAMANLSVALAEAKGSVTVGTLATVSGDATQLMQLFQNLIGNAIKFRGPEPLEVRISSARDGEAWRLTVQDNGIGIEPQYFERIFKVFQRLHTRKEYPGTGIGLAICKKIVERHGGRIWAESSRGQGSTFHFTVPDRRTEA